jgi:hypothetical protein
LQPLQNTNYYRLHQVDKDGLTTLSPTVLIKNTSQLNISQVYLFDVGIKYSINTPINTNTNFQLYDVTGRLLLSKTLQLQPGLNTGVIPIVNLSKGLYILSLTSDGKTVTQKIIK